jgi:hypothetical protein
MDRLHMRIPDTIIIITTRPSRTTMRTIALRTGYIVIDGSTRSMKNTNGTNIITMTATDAGLRGLLFEQRLQRC